MFTKFTFGSVYKFGWFGELHRNGINATTVYFEVIIEFTKDRGWMKASLFTENLLKIKLLWQKKERKCVTIVHIFWFHYEIVWIQIKLFLLEGFLYLIADKVFFFCGCHHFFFDGLQRTWKVKYCNETKKIHVFYYRYDQFYQWYLLVVSDKEHFY